MEDKILVIGSLNMDMGINMKNMPKKGETVLGDSLLYNPGGKGANQACAVGKLGGRAAILGCVGSDSFGEKLMDSLSGVNVDTSHICIRDQEPTGMALIYVDGNGDNSIVVVPGANRSCDISYLKEKDALIQESGYVIFQMEIPYETIFYGIRRTKELGKTVILNPAPAPERIPDEIWGMIDYLIPNETELQKLSGIRDDSMEGILSGARLLVQKGVKNVLVTLGDKGCLLVNGNMEELYPARKAEAVDTTAAGDCFIGTLAVGLAENMPMERAIGFANLASSIAVTKKGAQSSIPWRKECDGSR